MTDGTRPIFWLNILFVMALGILAVMGQWDWVVVIFLAMLMTNVVAYLRNKRGQ